MSYRSRPSWMLNLVNLDLWVNIRIRNYVLATLYFYSLIS
jgi:hypothetical protein